MDILSLVGEDGEGRGGRVREGVEEVREGGGRGKEGEERWVKRGGRREREGR